MVLSSTVIWDKVVSGPFFLCYQSLFITPKTSVLLNSYTTF